MKNESEYRVYYEDTDAGGVVYYANYLRFAERGRSELLRSLGFENNSLWEKENCGFVVKRLDADYKKPSRLDDVLIVETIVKTVKNSSFEMYQSIIRGQDIIFSMNVTLACIGTDYRPCRLPAAVKNALGDALEDGR